MVLDGVDVRRFEGAAGDNAPTGREGAIGLKSCADKPRLVAAFEHGSSGAVAPEEGAGIVLVGEPVNHVDTDQQNRLRRHTASFCPTVCRAGWDACELTMASS